MIGDRQHRALLDLVGQAYEARDLEELRDVLVRGLRRIIPADSCAYVGDHERHDPLFERFARTGDGRPYRLSDVVADAREHELAVFLETPPIALVLTRRHRGDFTDAEREMLGLLRPHLIQAHRHQNPRIGAVR